MSYYKTASFMPWYGHIGNVTDDKIAVDVAYEYPSTIVSLLSSPLPEVVKGLGRVRQMQRHYMDFS